MTSMTASQADGIDLLQSRIAITDLVHRYALNIRRGDAAACAELLTDDIEFIVRKMDPRRPDQVSVRSHTIGRVQVVAHIVGPLGDISLCPMIHNLLIEIEGDRARSTSVMENRTFPAIPDMIGEYQDEFRREDRWRFSRRIYTLFGQS